MSKYKDTSKQEKEEEDRIPLRIYNQIIKAVGTEKCDAYIDFTGGFRDTNLMMVSMIKYLEFSNIECLDVVYSHISNGKGKVKSIKHIYNLFQLVNGLSEFVTTSNAYILEKFFGKVEDPPELVKAIIKFSRGMSLCAVNGVEQNLKEVREAITKLETQKKPEDEHVNENLEEEKPEDEHGNENSKEQKSEDMHVQLYMDMLKSMIPLFKEKMDIDRIVPETGSISYPYLIKWCLNNRLLQQALTLYVEMMPLYYINQGIVKIPDNEGEEKEKEKKQRGRTVESTYFYENFFDEYCSTRKKRFQESVKKIIESKIIMEETLEETSNETSKKTSEKTSNETPNETPNETQEITYDLEGIRNEFEELGQSDEDYKLLREFIRDTYETVQKEGEKKSEGKKMNGNNKKEVAIPSSENAFYTAIWSGNLYGELRESFAVGCATYGKKIKGIENRAGLILEGNDEKLIKRMRYYLAIKYIRNNISHADSMSNNNEDEQKLIKYMRNHHIFNNDGEVTYDLICQVLERGIEIEF